MTNAELTAAFKWRELGLYAKDPDSGAEKLYCYGNVGEAGETIPAAGTNILERFEAINLTGAPGENFTAVIDQSLVFASVAELQDLAGLGRTTETVVGAFTAAEAAEMKVDALAGAGWTNETVVGAYTMAEAAFGQVGSMDEKIGSVGDTGGSTTAGSVMAKLNAILQKFISVWTDARAALLDRLDATVSSRATQTSVNTLQSTANTINDTKLGATNNTGGTATAGTVMAKLNALVGDSRGGKRVFTANGTFTVPAGVTTILVTACGGGGGGNSHSGGGGAACVIGKAYSVSPGTNIAITIASGGTGGTDAGSAGSATVVGSLVTLPGGGGTDAAGGAAGGIGGGRGGGVFNSVALPPDGGAGGAAGGDGRGGNSNGGGSAEYGGNTTAAPGQGGGGIGGSGGSGGVWNSGGSGGAGSAGGGAGGSGAYGAGGGGGWVYNSVKRSGGHGGPGIAIIEW